MPESFSHFADLNREIMGSKDTSISTQAKGKLKYYLLSSCKYPQKRWKCHQIAFSDSLGRYGFLNILGCSVRLLKSHVQFLDT